MLKDSVWHHEWCAPVMLHTAFDGTLLDFAAAPFPGVVGLAWDGRGLWALDDDGKRVCRIERTAEGRAFAQHYIGGVEERAPSDE